VKPRRKIRILVAGERRHAMLSDTVLGLVIAVIVISSVAWVAQFRRIKARIRLRRAVREHPAAVKVAH
jgi:hypothetical protein